MFPRVCSVCKHKFPYPNALWKHQLIHSHRRRETCPQCGKCVYDLKQHSLIHKPRTMHECLYCKKQCKTAGGLKYHLLSHAGEDKKTCLKCNARVVNLYDHMRSHHIKIYPICKKTLSPTSMKAHLERHNNSLQKNLVQCQICGSRFSTKDYLERHMQRHGKNYKIPCPVCKVPIVKYAFRDHLKIHGPRMMEKCHICGKQSLHLRQHLQKIHLKNRKRVKCHFCERSVLNITNHIKTHATNRPIP